MPVAAKLMSKLYQKFGDEVATELVDWMNAVEGSFRTEFSAMFDAQFSRIEARLAQLTAELRVEIEQRASASEKSLLRWMIALWFGQMGALIGMALAFKQFWN